MATVTKAKARQKRQNDIVAELSKILPAIADGLTVASNNWYDDYHYGHLDPEDEKLYETWRTLIGLIRRK
jgi:uridine phosphorylase